MVYLLSWLGSLSPLHSHSLPSSFSSLSSQLLLGLLHCLHPSSIEEHLFYSWRVLSVSSGWWFPLFPIETMKTWSTCCWTVWNKEICKCPFLCIENFTDVGLEVATWLNITCTQQCSWHDQNWAMLFAIKVVIQKQCVSSSLASNGLWLVSWRAFAKESAEMEYLEVLIHLNMDSACPDRNIMANIGES